jgi:hypothetical protein
VEVPGDRDRDSLRAPERAWLLVVGRFHRSVSADRSRVRRCNSLAHHQNKLVPAWFCLPVALQQVNLRVEPGLLAGLKLLAKERGLSLNAAAALAFEQFLQGQPQQKQAPASSDHDRRLLALERRVERLEAKPAAPPKAPSPERAKPAPPTEPAAIPQVGDGTISTAQLAAQLGIKRNTFNERLRRAGGASDGVVIEGWRCVGQAKPANGGPLQWQWQRI